ncbi:MAG: PilT/PilU family type 4a pilus ATPase [Deltaproteobacteria bacterium]|nr:PilT/PilU family type 4a pilus ATPase [Deltaproteobacteria bacterium]
MNYRAAKKEFIAAAWPDLNAQKEFVGEARALSRSELSKLLPLLLPEPGVTLEQRRARLSVWVMLMGAAPDGAWYQPMLKIAIKGDPGVRRVLLPLLMRCNDPSAHVEVVRLLKSPDAALRSFASELLQGGGGRAALEELAYALNGSGWSSRQEAMELACTLGGHHAIPILGRVINGGTRDDVLGALRLLGDPQYVKSSRRAAAEAIEPALYSRHGQVALEAMRALARSAPPDMFFERIAPFLNHEDPRLQRSAVQCMASAKSPTTIAILQRLYAKAPRGTRQVILRTLEEIGDDSVLPLLVDALSDESLPIRNASLDVVTKLARSGKIDPTRMVLWLLRSSDVNVRRQAIDVAQQVGDPLGEIWPKLLHLLRDEDWWVRERVVEALVALAGDQLTRHIVAYLQDDSDVVRRYAVEVLIRLEDPRSLGALLQVAKTDTDWWVRERAVECLGAIGDPQIVPHLAKLGESDETLYPAIVTALGALKSEKSLPILGRLLSHEDADLRLEALRVLGAIDDASLSPRVRPLLTDKDKRVRAEARDLMLGWQARVEESEVDGLEARLKGFERLLWWAVKEGGDDLFLIADQPPYIKTLGQMKQLSNQVFTAAQVESTVRGMMSEVQEEQFDRLEDADFSIGVKSLGLRFRVNVLRQSSGVSAVFRKIVQDVRPLDELGVPKLVSELCDLPDGLVLIGGPTGSGKSTTLAAMIHHINRRHGRHIITIEDPIEVVHEHLKSVITQREVGTHTRSFGRALRATLREDPDVILVGEMRDLETIQFALSAAETGHLVLATVHTVSADTSVDRLIDAFPPGHQMQVRAMLAHTLRAVVCQHLLRRKDGTGRVPAVEIMLNTDATANHIRRGQCFQLPSVMQTSRELGMQMMDDQLLNLVQDGIVSAPEAYAKALDKSLFEHVLAAEVSGVIDVPAPKTETAPPWAKAPEPGL